MRPLLGLLLVYAVINLGVVALGTALGFLLRFLFPGVDLGTGILIGVVSTGVSIHFFLRLMQWLETYGDDPEEDDAFRRIVMYPLGPPPPRRNRNRKRKPK